MPGPLANVKVLSFGRALAGPYAAMLLADLGAEVIKIENPGSGDMARANGPFIQDVSSYFLSVNRGKKGLSLNLRSEMGRKIVLGLLPAIDILVENFRPGTMEKMGLGYESVKEVNPRLIYISISGFGQSGPYSKKPAFDMVAQAMGGAVSITGELNRPPVRVGFSIGDLGAGLFATAAGLAALYESEKSGLGQHIDVAMLDSQVALCENACARYFATGEIPRPIGVRHPLVTPFQIFPTKTDDMVVIAFGDEDWKKICQAIGRKELIEEWLEIFDRVGIASSPVNNIEQVVHDPQVRQRDMVLTVEHKRLGKLKVVGTPMKFSRTPCRIECGSPDLGEHTTEILAEQLKFSEEQIKRLKEEDVI
jgi:CoA:oxalate CoA-transferase